MLDGRCCLRRDCERACYLILVFTLKFNVKFVTVKTLASGKCDECRKAVQVHNAALMHSLSTP
jgi:hypothetical protein